MSLKAPLVGETIVLLIKSKDVLKMPSRGIESLYQEKETKAINMSF